MDEMLTIHEYKVSFVYIYIYIYSF